MMDLDNTGTITLPDFKTLLKEQLGISGDDAEASALHTMLAECLNSSHVVSFLYSPAHRSLVYW